MTISLSDDARKQSIASIKRYFAEEIEQDIGELKAGLLLEFILTGGHHAEARRQEPGRWTEPPAESHGDMCNSSAKGVDAGR
jgi:hypothetical protein